MAETGFRKIIITFTVVMAAIIELIDTSIVNVALTNISGNIGATLEDVAWVVTSYAIANVIIIPMTSFFAALFGRRNYYMGSIILFTLASMACGQAHTLWELVAFRFIQGIGGGALLSTSQAILFETYTVEQRGFASAIFGVGVFIGPTIGPTVGGWIIDNYSWPWIFYINMPIGILAVVLSYLYVKEPAHVRATHTIDWTGIGLLISGLAALQTVLERGEAEDWFSAKYIIVLTFIAAACLISFIIHELKTEHPVVDLHVLVKSRSLATAATLTFVLGFALFSTVFIVPVFAQRLLNFTAMQTGMLFLPGAGVALIILPIIGKLLTKGVPSQLLIIVGFLIVALFAGMLANLNLSANGDQFFWPVIIRAIGLSLMTIPLTQLAVSGLQVKDIPQGVALNNMMRQVGGSFGVALINTFIDHRIVAHRTALVSHMNVGSYATESRINSITHGLMAHGVSAWEASRKALGILEFTIQRQSELLSYIDAFRAVSIISVICIPIIFLAGKTKKPTAAKIAAAANESH